MFSWSLDTRHALFLPLEGGERGVTASTSANRHRISPGVQWNPYTHIQLDVQYRALFDAATFTEHEALGMFRFWF